MSRECKCGCKGQPSPLRQFIQGHNRRLALDLDRYVIQDCGYRTACHTWIGPVGDGGYGRVQFRNTHMGAHKAAYIKAVGEVPEGFVLDHLCRNRLCIRPDHLEPVTDRTNILRGIGPTAENARKTHCLNGHPLSGDNLIESPGRRRCRACRTSKDREAWLRRRERLGA